MDHEVVTLAGDAPGRRRPRAQPAAPAASAAVLLAAGPVSLA